MEELTETPGEDERRGSTLGVLFLGGLAAGAAMILFKIAPDLGVGLTWIIGWGSVIRAAKKMPNAANPAPPPPPERGCEEEPQVSTVRDKAHPNRWLILRSSGWMTEEISKETGTI